MLDHRWPSPWMGTCRHLYLLFLLLFNCHRVISDFTINGITTTFEPGPNVTRDTSVNVICHADVSRSPGFTLMYEFHIMKDGTELNRTTSDSDTYSYSIKAARVTDSGVYRCKLFIKDKNTISQSQTLTVTGTAQPLISVDQRIIKEGEKLTATCRAPGERGPFTYYFYVNSQSVDYKKSDSNEFSVELPSLKSGANSVTCKYSIALYLSFVSSRISEPLTVQVKDIGISVSVDIKPSRNIIEADNFTVTCKVNPLGRADSVSLIKGTGILATGNGRTEHSREAREADAGEYMCRVEINGVVKVDRTSLTVEELFSKPNLTRNPSQAFEGERVALTCKSTHLERLRGNEIKYSIYKDGNPRPMGNVPGQMSIMAGPQDDGNYSCKAEAKSITKESEVIVVRSKVLASVPEIFVMEKVILGKQFTIRCKSNGTLPITYTLFRDGKEMERNIIHHLGEEAVFHATITKKNQTNGFQCRAQNHGASKYQDSKPLSAFVVEHLDGILLRTTPVPQDVEEGANLTLLCDVIEGTPPITFAWYSTGRKAYIHTNTVNTKYSSIEVPWIEKLDSGEYYCSALNAANKIESNRVIIEVKLATWKKALIVVICLLVIVALVVVVVVRIKARRGKRETTTELSVKPASPKSDDAIAVTMSHDTPFLNKDAVSHLDAMEGNASVNGT